MHKIAFIFVLGLVTGYMIAGLSDATVAPQGGTPSETHNAVTESVAATDGASPWLEDEQEAKTKTLIDERIGVRLSYRTEPHGYMVKAAVPAPSDPTFIKGYEFMLIDDAEAMQRGMGDTEGPATIMLFAYKNPDRLAPSVWASANPSLSGIQRARSDTDDMAVGGANGVRYVADGLYLTDTVIVAEGNLMYVITGSYIDEYDATFVDFDPFLESIEFMPVS